MNCRLAEEFKVCILRRWNRSADRQQSESHVRQSGRVKLISRLIVNISPVLRPFKERFAKPDADAHRHRRANSRNGLAELAHRKRLTRVRSGRLICSLIFCFSKFSLSTSDVGSRSAIHFNTGEFYWSLIADETRRVESSLIFPVRLADLALKRKEIKAH